MELSNTLKNLDYGTRSFYIHLLYRGTIRGKSVLEWKELAEVGKDFIDSLHIGDELDGRCAEYIDALLDELEYMGLIEPEEEGISVTLLQEIILDKDDKGR